MDSDAETLRTGEIEVLPGSVVHVYARPGAARPFVLGVTNDGRTCTAELTPLQYEAFITLLDAVGRQR